MTSNDNNYKDMSSIKMKKARKDKIGSYDFDMI